MSIKILFKLFLLSLLILFTLEVILRFQQRIGPIIDLEFEKVSLGCLSDLINHKNIGESTSFFNGREIRKVYDKNGIRIDKSASNYSNYNHTFKILCMGDSTMEGFDDEDTIPRYIQEYLQKTKMRGVPIRFLNAGCSSYSPAIFIPQAKMLIPLLKPDFVLIDIDETDLGDDFIRYKDLIVRDKIGKIIAVRRTPINYLFLSVFMQIKRQPLYLTRLFSKIYHTRIYMPIVIKRYRGKDNQHPLSFSWDKDGSYKKYTTEISFFENNLTELVETFIDLMGEKRRILFIYHPHLQHINPDTSGFYWNSFVSGTIKKVCKKYQIAFYNATEDLKTSFKNDQRKYYITNDMHFNYEGLKVYSDLVSDRLFLMIEPLIKEINKN